jgi:hypothetical protein
VSRLWFGRTCLIREIFIVYSDRVYTFFMSKEFRPEANAHDEAALERALWFLYQQWKLVGFRPRGLYQMFTPRHKEYMGGVAAIQTVLRQGSASGFEFLSYRGKRQLSIESLVLREAWAHLFNDCDRRIAELRLSGIPEGAGRERIGAG